MFQWIADFVGRWAGFVGTETRDLVHWTTHALAQVVYTVFGHVGKAWHDFWLAMVAAHTAIDRFAAEVIGKFTEIIRVELPRIWAYAVAGFKTLESLAWHLWRDAIAAVRAAEQLAQHLVAAALRWVVQHVWDPLVAVTRQLRADLLKWGYYSFQLLTHPARLAQILLDALVAAAEAAFDRLAVPVGTFALRLIVRNLSRVLHLAEAVITAVL